MSKVFRFGFGLLWLAASPAACTRDPAPSVQPRVPAFFYPPGKPGGSITNMKQCECRACNPASCCGAEQIENVAVEPPECNASYTFPAHCGITVQTCTPRCYSHVWRIEKQQSCSADPPLVCCG